MFSYLFLACFAILVVMGIHCLVRRRISIVLFLVFVGPPAAYLYWTYVTENPVHNGKRASKWVQQLRAYRSEAEVTEALTALDDIGERAMASLTIALEDADPRVITRAADTLATICSRGTSLDHRYRVTFKYFTKVLTHSGDPSVRAHVAEALGRSGRLANNAVVTDALTKLSHDDPEPTVRDAATRALNTIHEHPNAVPEHEHEIVEPARRNAEGSSGQVWAIVIVVLTVFSLVLYHRRMTARNPVAQQCVHDRPIGWLEQECGKSAAKCELTQFDPYFENRLREPLPREIAFCGFVLLGSADPEYPADVRNLPFPAKCVRCLAPTDDDVKVTIGVPDSQDSWLSRKYVRRTLYLNVPFCEKCRNSQIRLPSGGAVPVDVGDYFKIRIHNAGVGVSVLVGSEELRRNLFEKIRRVADQLAGQHEGLQCAIKDCLNPSKVWPTGMESCIAAAIKELNESPAWMDSSSLQYGTPIFATLRQSVIRVPGARSWGIVEA